MVFQLLPQDACNEVLYHSSDYPREALFGRMGEERKTPELAQFSLCQEGHLYTTAPDL